MAVTLLLVHASLKRGNCTIDLGNFVAHLGHRLIEHYLQVCFDTIDVASERGDATLPWGTLVSAVVNRGDPKQELVIIDCLFWNNLDEVGQDFNLLAQGWLISNLTNACKRITHDRDQHVKEGDLCDEGGDNKDDQRRDCSPRLHVAVSVELTETEQVLIKHYVCKGVSEVLWDEGFWLTFIEDEEGVAEGHKNEYEQDQEVPDVVYGLQDQLDVEWGIRPEAKPVECFEPHAYNYGGGDVAERLGAKPWRIEGYRHCHEQVHYLQEYVDVVERIREVVATVADKGHCLHVAKENDANQDEYTERDLKVLGK